MTEQQANRLLRLMASMDQRLANIERLLGGEPLPADLGRGPRLRPNAGAHVVTRRREHA